MNLLIDSGNTLTKVAVFGKKKLIEVFRFQDFDEKNIYNLKKKYTGLKKCIYCSVTTKKTDFLCFLGDSFDQFIDLGPETRIPVENFYSTRNSLGADRIALVVGANNMFPQKSVLVVDLGSAITFDLVNSDGQYLGGNISPGLSMRFKALNKFTSKLPLLAQSDDFSLISDNTEQAIISGVQKGIIYEIEGYYSELKKKYRDLKVIISGGDAFFFENKLNFRTFVKPDLIFFGLKRILEYNDI